MDLPQELEVLKKKEEVLLDLIKSFELQQHKLQSESNTLELIIGNENLVKNSENFPITQPILPKSIGEHESELMYRFESDHNRLGAVTDFHNDINLEPNLTIKHHHQNYEEEEDEEDAEDDRNKKFTIL